VITLSERDVEAIVLGGGFFGGGGGGEVSEGLRVGRLVLELGDLRIVGLDEVPGDCYIATASLVGAPAMGGYVKPYHMLRSTELFVEALGRELCGLISSEVGGLTVTNGWVQAALLGIPIVDAPADGRAHPTGVMGSMGLHRLRDYVSIQAAVGGRKEAGNYVEIVARGSLQALDRIVREASVRAGGMVAVTRNPVTRDYLRENAAVGALSLTLRVGYAMLERRGDAVEMSSKVAELLGGRVVDVGVVEDVRLESRGGYDVGDVVIRGRTSTYRVVFWNEYMSLEDRGGNLLALFPDLIVTVSTRTSTPVTSATIRRGDEVVLVTVPRDRVLLGSGVKDPEVLKQVSEVVGMVPRRW
jgi:DUF917 family protein